MIEGFGARRIVYGVGILHLALALSALASYHTISRKKNQFVRARGLTGNNGIPKYFTGNLTKGRRIPTTPHLHIAILCVIGTNKTQCLLSLQYRVRATGYSLATINNLHMTSRNTLNRWTHGRKMSAAQDDDINILREQREECMPQRLLDRWAIKFAALHQRH